MIPASAIVQIIPSVINGGGSALNLNGIMLTKDTAVPIGTLKSFASQTDVAAFFGSASTEAALASVYFGGYQGATLLPANLMFAQFNDAAVAGYLRGGALALTLTQLQAFSGVLTISVNGTPKTSATINLSAATSFSNAATIIAAGFTTFGATCTWDAQRGAFLFTSSTTGAASTMSVATGTLAANLNLTVATGAVVSAGADIAVAATAMDAIKAISLNWATFMTVYEPLDAVKIALSAWNNGQNNRFAYVGWTAAVGAITTPDTTTFMASVVTAGYSGTVGVYGDATHAAFVLGTTASLNFNATNGRITYAFKYQSGLAASVTNETVANALTANGYNFVGQYATANQGFTFFFKGIVSGVYKFIDEYVNQIYLNSQFQLALMNLLTQTGSIPYSTQGNTLIAGACQAPIDQMLNFGGINTGITLSAAQVAQVNNQAGRVIDGTLSTRGWYLLVGQATAQVRSGRTSPPISFWYMDGGSVQQINMPSIVIQ
jgi:hypothetical protein